MAFPLRAAAASLLLCRLAVAASAPESITETVFRESGGVASLRSLWERTVLFGADGRYRFIKVASASTIFIDWRLGAPPPDGQYAYRKTGEFTGTITFSDPTTVPLYGTSGQDSSPGATIALEFDRSPAREDEVGRGRYFNADARLIGTFTLARTQPEGSRNMANISMRGMVAPGRPLIVGFVIQGEPRDVLIRVIGPSLSHFGVASRWADPKFELHRPSAETPSTRTAMAYHDDWASNASAAAGLRKLSAHVGAFPLIEPSRDAMGVTTRFVPDTYTIVCSTGDSDPGGEALVEVYMLP